MSDRTRNVTELPQSGPETAHSAIKRRAGLAAALRALTPARVGLGCTGVSQETRDLLDFERCHAQARDAVHAQLDGAALAVTLKQMGGEVLRLHSMATDRAEYLRRPDLGRRLDEASRNLMEKVSWKGGFDLVLIVADGLSALAVERHAQPLLAELLQRLEGWKLAPLCIAEQGRVAIGDEIGAALCATMAVVLIGERPGLSSPDSLGAYVTWEPRPGRTDAERNCVSNIRPEGLNYAPAAARLAYILAEARRQRLTGVALEALAPRLKEVER